ncbi:MAG: hypothetical protein CMQ41_12605 [Gammaproteobacteria bacterium]|nr:hypothetical protein [Gammaproteobacteria bacterium]|tara:strand:- start:2518 stop:3609 length:1092 start_codon:yes stop_codon:yes gene_type:complete
MKTLAAENIKDLCSGAAFLATGGGGDPYVSQLQAERLLKKFGPANLLAPAQVPNEFFVVSIGMVGAPTVTLEQLPTENEAVGALNKYEEITGKKVDAVIPFEVGGGNSTIPLFVAAIKGVPCIDGDGMGRALPEAQMMTFPIYGVHPTPAVVMDFFGNHVLLECNDAHSFEIEIRAKAVEMGGMVSSAEHGMSGALVRKSAVPGTISFATNLGNLLRNHGGHIDVIQPQLFELFGDSDYGVIKHLFAGKIIDSQRKVIGGYDVGNATLQSFADPNVKMSLYIKNEYLVAKIGERVVASVPDLICIVEQETSRPLNAERMRYGQRVSVFGVGCTHHYRTPEALKVTEPRAFGFDLDYVPLEEIS